MDSKIQIGVIAGDSDVIELIISKIRERSGDDTLDWGYFGGRGVVWCTDPDKVSDNKLAFMINMVQFYLI